MPCRAETAIGFPPALPRTYNRLGRSLRSTPSYLIERMTFPSRHIARQSFNLGWSFPELDLPGRIVAAGRSGFRLVECHSPYDWPVELLKGALAESGARLL